MVEGIGIDIIEIKRMLMAIRRHGEPFLERLFTPQERNYCSRYGSEERRAAAFAGRFSAKEAVVKALGTGFGSQAAWHEVEISNDAEGRPYITLKGKLEKQFTGYRVDVSISHCRSYASAVAIRQTL